MLLIIMFSILVHHQHYEHYVIVLKHCRGDAGIAVVLHKGEIILGVYTVEQVIRVADNLETYSVEHIFVSYV